MIVSLGEINYMPNAGIILWMRPTNERWRYICDVFSHWLDVFTKWFLKWKSCHSHCFTKAVFSQICMNTEQCCQVSYDLLIHFEWGHVVSERLLKIINSQRNLTENIKKKWLAQELHVQKSVMLDGEAWSCSKILGVFFNQIWITIIIIGK